MKNVRMPAILICSAVMIVVLAGCDENLSATDATGVINGYFMSETYDSPDQVSEDSFIRSILNVTGDLLEEDILVVTDDSGFYSVPDLSPGVYTIHPVHCSTEYDVTVEVVAGSTATANGTIPRTGYCVFQINDNLSSPPFNEIDIRKALSLSVDRFSLVSDMKAERYVPMTSFIPQDFSLPNAASLNLLEYNPVSAESLLTAQSLFDFTVKIWGSNTYSIFFPFIQAYWEALTAVGVVTETVLNSTFWPDILAGDFQIASYVRIANSNNMLEYFKILLSPGFGVTYENSTIDTLIADGDQALADGDLGAYEDAVIAINNLLMEEMPFIPLWGIVSYDDTTPPEIQSTIPADGATNVSGTDLEIIVTFNEQMKTGVSILFEATGAQHNLKWVDYHTLYITFDTSIAADTLVTLTLNPDGYNYNMMDIAGNILAPNTVYSFTTAP